MDDTPKKRIVPRWLEDNHNHVKPSKAHELRLAKELGGKREARSGANRFSSWDNRTMGRDINLASFLVEHKHTIKASISLKKEWLDGISKSSLAAMKQPMVIITFDEDKKSEDWALVPLEILKRLMDSQE